MSEPAELNAYRNREDGTLISYAWPGGYPMYYLDAQNNILCPDCAREFDSVDVPDPYSPVAGDVHWEGPPLTCDECGAEIQSAYGDPDKEEE